MINANQGVSATDAAGHGLGGDLKCATSTFTFDTNLTVGQSVAMLAVPAGARIIDARIAAEGFTDGTFNLGDAEVPARFADGVVPASSLTKNSFHLYRKSTVLKLTAKTAPTAKNGVLKLAVFYIVDGVSPRDM
ncbi:hypothetical protein WJT86_10100 [Microvirga sp. W0021]|uniref:Uncharacterized protein n=1 Tax=Hohaiivirga grylli TaxID=3133970 RepID=A0ABV0BK94_9HYPH